MRLGWLRVTATTKLPPDPKRPRDHLTLVSVSRVSPSRAGEARRAHEREHGVNRGTARQHGFRVVGQLDFVESALAVERFEVILQKVELEEAAGIVVPTLRRLAVGPAQTEGIRTIDEAGYVVLSGKDKETALLRDRRSHVRSAELMMVAADDYYDWARTNAKRAQRSKIPAYWTTPEGLATIAFVEERPHLKTRRLAAAILEAHGYLTAEGKTTWYPAQVSRVRAYGEALRNAGTAALREQAIERRAMATSRSA